MDNNLNYYSLKFGKLYFFLLFQNKWFLFLFLDNDHLDADIVESVINGDVDIGEDNKDDIISTDDDDVPLEYKVTEASPEPEPLILQNSWVRNRISVTTFS